MTASIPDDPQRLADFEAERPRLRALAYRMVGIAAEADDVVQDAWVRYATSRESPERAAAWLTTVVTRLCLDRLKSARATREAYVGPWLPEPIADDEHDPEQSAIMAESLSLAFMAVLERLSPLERAVFLLAEVFDVSLASIATMIERSEPATRQLAKRARDHVRQDRPRFEPDTHDVVQLGDAFMEAALSGDLERLETLLVDDVVHVSDGGPHHRAARAPVVGKGRVARLFVNLAKRAPAGAEVHQVRANGQHGVFITVDGAPFLLLVSNWVDGKMSASTGVRNPAKLRAFHRQWAGAELSE